MTHTIGPWRVGSVSLEDGKPYGINIAGPDGYHVAKVSSRSAMNGENAYGGENRANANLIAAAPDMLKVLKRIESLMDFDDTRSKLFNGLQKQMADAIKKAECL